MTQRSDNHGASDVSLSDEELARLLEFVSPMRPKNIRARRIKRKLGKVIDRLARESLDADSNDGDSD